MSASRNGFVCLKVIGRQFATGASDFHSGTKKPVMPKKKVFVARNLKDSYQIYHSDHQKQKRKSKFLYRDNFVIP
jgi:hypothetical protein